jgi:hypothetical protein
MANADRYKILSDMAGGGNFGCNLDMGLGNEPGEEPGGKKAFFEDSISYASETDDDEEASSVEESPTKRYTDDGDRIQQGVRDVLEDVEKESKGRFDPAFGAVSRARLLEEAKKLLQQQMRAKKETQTWGDYDPSLDPIALDTHTKNDWYVEGISRRTKLVDNPFIEGAERSSESRIDAVSSLGIPDKGDLLTASRFGAMKASQKDLMVAKVMRKRNPKARTLLRRLVKEMAD